MSGISQSKANAQTQQGDTKAFSGALAIALFNASATSVLDDNSMERVFQNCTSLLSVSFPSIITLEGNYTFAHAFIKNDMFIKELKDLMSKEAIKKALEETEAQIRDAESQVQSDLESVLNMIVEQFELHVKQAAEAFEKEMSGTFGSLEKLQEAFDREKQLDDLYVDDYKKVYEYIVEVYNKNEKPIVSHLFDMFDNALYFSKIAQQRSTILKELKLDGLIFSFSYSYVTIGFVASLTYNSFIFPYLSYFNFAENNVFSLVGISNIYFFTIIQCAAWCASSEAG